MKLASFRIQNYRSIIDTEEVELSNNDNVSVFAGQNESGKSSILKALRDFAVQEFDPNSMPFDTGKELVQVVSCTYKVETSDNVAESIARAVINGMSARMKTNLRIKEGQKIFDENILKRIQKFTLIASNENGKFKLAIDENSFRLFQSSILDNPKRVKKAEDGGEVKEKYIKVDDDQNEYVARLFWTVAPSIVFFDDFCDLLPDKISVSNLNDEDSSVPGYQAVRNLENILKTDFAKKDKEADSTRRIRENRENKAISVDFRNDWAKGSTERMKSPLSYDFQKRDEGNSYINFYVQTKEGEPLPPRNRSKGLIWFLSLWLELRAQDIQNKNLVLLLDEPDQHLHIKAQEDILRLINRLANQGDQILYATHSPNLIQVDFLSRIQLVLNTEAVGTKVESPVSSRIDTENKKDALQPIANAIGFGVSGFSPPIEKNILLEGVSDFYYFSGMKKLLNKAGDYAFIPGVGLRKINSLISLLVGYGVSWIAIIDDDPSIGGKDSMKKFDEIKDFVFDGDDYKTKEKVCVLNGIVGIENMFTYNDFKLVGPKVSSHNDMVKVVGRKRKVLFSKLFFEKVNNGEITAGQISNYAKDNFKKAFDFIEQNLLNNP